jgi:hypothetical protein
VPFQRLVLVERRTPDSASATVPRMVNSFHGERMNLRDLLRKHKTAVTEKWLDKTLATYPSRTSVFFKRTKDPFANPVGNTLSSGIEAVFDDLLETFEDAGSVSAEQFCSHLDDIIKVRSVQEFSPSQAVSFVFLLKEAVREELREELGDVHSLAELARFEARIDQLALFSFDIYTKRREKLHELRVNEIKRTGFRLLKKANLISIDDEPEPEEDWALTGVCRPRGDGQ